MSTAAIPVHVALVDSTGTVPASDLAEVAGALNEQVQADFVPRWHVKATVGAYPRHRPARGAIELHSTDSPGALGFHADAHHQPFAKVAIDVGQWTVTASHELLEMLGDPWGNRLHSARALAGWPGDQPAGALPRRAVRSLRGDHLSSRGRRGQRLPGARLLPQLDARDAGLLPHRRSHRAAADRATAATSASSIRPTGTSGSGSSATARRATGTGGSRISVARCCVSARTSWRPSSAPIPHDTSVFVVPPAGQTDAASSPPLAHPLVHPPRREREHGDAQAAEDRGLDPL